jgi:hypothetical protein
MSTRPGTTGTFEFDPATNAFHVTFEGLLVNNLYPKTNPISTFDDVTAFLMPNQSQLLVFDDAPMIVPGVPGEPPINNLGMAYIPTRATFDPPSKLLTFGNDLAIGLVPDVSLVRTPEGTYVNETGSAEPVVGASFSINPLQFLGQDSTDRFLFGDSSFSIFNSSGAFASGRLTDIGIDPLSFSFTADVTLDDVPGELFSPFIQNWAVSPTISLLGPVATLDLVSATEGFSVAGGSPTDFINASRSQVPEPSTLMLLGSGLGLYVIVRMRRPRK